MGEKYTHFFFFFFPSSSQLDAFAYHGVFPSITKTTVGKYKESHQGGVPLVFYNHTDTSLPMTIFSPLNLPKAHHMASTNLFVGAGIKSTATLIPAGHSQLYVEYMYLVPFVCVCVFGIYTKFLVPIKLFLVLVVALLSILHLCTLLFT